MIPGVLMRMIKQSSTFPFRMRVTGAALHHRPKLELIDKACFTSALSNSE